MELKILEGEKPKEAKDAEVVTVEMEGVLYARTESKSEEKETYNSGD